MSCAFNAVLINAVTRRQRPYRSNHPLAIPRTALAIDLIRAYDAVNADEIVQGRIAAAEELAWFHAPDYIAAMRAAEINGRLQDGDRERYQLGTVENPYFDDLFSIPARATGGSIQAAEAVLGGKVAFNPAGGMHHARAASAQGFCYFNDPVLAILKLQQAGWRVLYVDIDAHHGDGVEAAFIDDPEVLTLSLHMDTAYAYPFRGGRFEDCGSARAGHSTINVPLPQGTHDAEYRLIFDAVWGPALARFQPDAVVLQAGTDMLAADPLGKLSISTECFLEIVQIIFSTVPRHAEGTPRLLVTGGGGYHPLLVARAWTGLWALLSGRELAAAIPPPGVAVLRSAGWDRDADEDYFHNLFNSRFDNLEKLEISQSIQILINSTQHHPYFSS
jgi:acetoin utilization protein AcuC